MIKAPPIIAVLGASGLIGEAVTRDLLIAGSPVRGLARRFTSAQKAAFAEDATVAPVVELSVEQLGELLKDVQIVVNCIGVLQDSESGSTVETHETFVSRLLAAMGSSRLLVHVSIPKGMVADSTPFSVTKRRAELLIRAGGTPYVILRPGFVVGEAAYGGSALIRALAAWPLALPARYADAQFAATDIHDLSLAISSVMERWAEGRRNWDEDWDVMEDRPGTVGDVLNAFRTRMALPMPLFRLPVWALVLATRGGDLVSRLGWSPPARTTALVEMARGVRGDPGAFISATGIVPHGLDEILRRNPATAQEKWFSRLYLLKPLMLVVLSIFWCVSGMIALLAFPQASTVLTSHRVPQELADAITLISSCLDIGVGLLIAFRRTSKIGLWAGIGVSLGYMLGAVVLTPELWLEPLGALVKTGPAIVLMGLALAMMEER